MSSSPPRISSDFGAPENRPLLTIYDLHHLRIWHEAADIREAAEKALIGVKTMQNKLLDIRRQLKLSDDADLREYINCNGWPEPFPVLPPQPIRPPPSGEFTGLLAKRKLAWDKLSYLSELTVYGCQMLGLDMNLLRSSHEAYMHEWFKWDDVWPGGEFRPHSPDEALLALLLRREFLTMDSYRDSGNLLITLHSQDPRVDAEARGRIFWALELEPQFAYWIGKEAPFPPRPPQIDPRFMPGGSEFPRARLSPLNSNLHTDLPYVLPNGEQCPSRFLRALRQTPGPKLLPHQYSRFSFSVDDWDGPNDVTVSVGLSYGPLCGNGSHERLHRNGDSWRSVVVERWVS